MESAARRQNRALDAISPLACARQPGGWVAVPAVAVLISIVGEIVPHGNLSGGGATGDEGSASFRKDDVFSDLSTRWRFLNLLLRNCALVWF